MENYLNKLVGTIVRCRKNNNDTFVAKLIGIQDCLLIFENRKGQVIADNINDIAEIVPMPKSVNRSSGHSGGRNDSA